MVEVLSLEVGMEEAIEVIREGSTSKVGVYIHEEDTEEGRDNMAIEVGLKAILMIGPLNSNSTMRRTYRKPLRIRTRI